MIDEHTFNALYRETLAPLRAYAVRVLGNVSHADDIVQETYLRLLRSPVSIDEPGALRAYVFRIASNLMTDHFRSGRRERPLDEDADRSVPDSDHALSVDMTRLNSAGARVS